ncbi:MAG: SUMF1/EgtB/PvdO family nonheme iron enzyme [Bacteroidota bacterium]
MKLSSLLCLVLTGMLFTSGTFQPTRQGKDYALFFAVDNYVDPGWPDLKNPIRDAEAIAKELREMYGFETRVYSNPTKNKIRTILRSWQNRRFDSDAQLFVFISGHGDFDEGANQGYFVPREGKFNDTYNDSHLGLNIVGQTVAKIPCKHILLAIDACYSGTIDREIALRGKTLNRPKPATYDERQPVIDIQLRNTTRLLLTSGGKERTPDGKEHSPFASAILKALRSAYINGGDGMVLFSDIESKMERVRPLPHKGELEGHEDGGFVFVGPFAGSSSSDIPLRVSSPGTNVPSSSPTKKILDLPNAPRMIFIKGGTFSMGSNERSNEKPIHSVTVNDFYLAETEVTNAQFAAFLNAKGNQEEGGVNWYNTEGSGVSGYAKPYIKKNSRGTWVVDEGKESYPVNYVSWYGSVAYCKWLGSDYRLPTEAEWEYAAGNAAKHSKYSWGDGNPTTYKGGNLRDESFKRINSTNIWESYDDGYTGLSPVAQFGANELGLYDMTGSLWEWCSDWYGGKYYASSPKLNPQGHPSGTNRVFRGGGWGNDPSRLRVADRLSSSPSSRYFSLGFRPARTL